MPLKSFTELYKVDLEKEIKLKPTFAKDASGKLVKTDKSKWLDYLEWATVLTLLYKHGAGSVTFGTLKNATGYPAFYHQDRNPFVSVWVNIDGTKYELDYPVIDGNRVDESPNQMTINKAHLRGFVKCVAINTGLGLKLWQKEESDFNELTPVNESSSTLPELIPGTSLWNEAVKAMKNGYTLLQIQKKYYLSPENQDKLCEDAF